MTDPIGETVQLEAADGHALGAYRVPPAGTPRGGVVILQEIFGVTRHIRAVAHQYADAGYLAIAPALFDRLERDADVPYADVPRGYALMQRLDRAQALLDVGAAVAATRAAGRVGVVGFCWGGALAYSAACHLPLAAAVCYYGGRLPQLLAHTPRCPVMFHFGERDAHIPASDVDQVRAAYPAGIYHLYPADHGFNCTDRASFDAASAELALQRTIEFLHRYVG
jgi:carboxymethylenebutenolidase